LWDACHDQGLVTIAGPRYIRKRFFEGLHESLRDEVGGHNDVICLAESDPTIYLAASDAVEPLRLAFRRWDNINPVPTIAHNVYGHPADSDYLPCKLAEKWGERYQGTSHDFFLTSIIDSWLKSQFDSDQRNSLQQLGMYDEFRETPVFDRFDSTFRYAQSIGILNRVVIAYDCLSVAINRGTNLPIDLPDVLRKLSKAPWATVFVGWAPHRGYETVPWEDIRVDLQNTTYRVDHENADLMEITRGDSPV